MKTIEQDLIHSGILAGGVKKNLDDVFDDEDEWDGMTADDLLDDPEDYFGDEEDEDFDVHLEEDDDFGLD